MAHGARGGAGASGRRGTGGGRRETGGSRRWTVVGVLLAPCFESRALCSLPHAPRSEPHAPCPLPRAPSASPLASRLYPRHPRNPRLKIRLSSAAELAEDGTAQRSRRSWLGVRPPTTVPRSVPRAPRPMRRAPCAVPRAPCAASRGLRSALPLRRAPVAEGGDQGVH